MAASSMSTALIQYTPQKYRMEFSEQLKPSLSIPSSPSELVDLNLRHIAKIFAQPFTIQENSLPSCRIDRPLIPYNPRFSLIKDLMPRASKYTHSRLHFSSMPEISEEMQKLWHSQFNTLHVSSRESSSSKKLNGEEIAEALQAEAAFTIATDEKPVVATYGAGPCIALGGYDATNKLAFVVHFSNAGEVRKSGGTIFYNISKLAKEKIEKPIQLHLRGGIKGQSEAIVEAIKIWMKQRSDLPMEIASEDILDSGMSFGGKSLSIDSRTGEVAEYDPMANPHHRDISELDAMMAIMSAFEPRIRLAYSPKS